MKKSEALTVLYAKIVGKAIDIENMLDRREIENQIRIASDNDEGFEDVVFELGCTTLAKAYEKSFRK